MNIIFVLLIAVAYFATLWQQLHWNPLAPALLDNLEALSPMQVLANSIFSSAEQAVHLSINLIGIMTFFLGLMKIAESIGLLRVLAKLLYPVMRRLFPDVPPDHPAQGAIIMNISANLLGLGNAATPFGIKAMQALDSLNQHKGTATNAMILFLAMNTASITLLPTKVIALRSAAGSHHPSDIIITTLFASFCATCMAILASKLLQRFFVLAPADPAECLSTGQPLAATEELGDLNNESELQFTPYASWISYSAIALFIIMIPLIMLYGRSYSPWVIPSLTLIILGIGLTKKIPVYEIFTEGAKEGFWVSVRIIPYLVSILVAMAMLKASGALDLITHAIGSFTAQFGLPAEALPMVLMRPLSGTGSLGIMTSIINDPGIGPDSYLGYLVSTLMGSTDTTFYIIAVYFGAIQIKNIRHTLPAALLADLTGIIAAVYIVNLLYG